MLKNDSGTPEFVLDGKYYSLPFPLHQLIRNGWDSVPTWGGNGSKSINEIPLSEGEYANIQISASYGQIHLIVTQLNQNGSDIKDATVVGVYYRSEVERKELETLPNTDFFVTKFGLTKTTSYKTAKEVTAGKIDQSFFGVTPRTEGLAIDLTYYGVIYDIQSDRYSDLFSGKSHPQLVGSYEAVLEEKL